MQGRIFEWGSKSDSGGNGLLHDTIVKKVYLILDELILAGELQETSKRVILDRLKALESMDTYPSQNISRLPKSLTLCGTRSGILKLT